MFAIIETGGKQYTVKENSIIHVEKLSAEEGEAAGSRGGKDCHRTRNLCYRLPKRIQSPYQCQPEQSSYLL